MRFAQIALVLAAFAAVAFGQDLAKPKIRLVGVTDTVNNGYALRSYEIEIVNRAEFPNELFQASPALPPCGINTNAARTWINIYNEGSVKIYGWCAIRDNGELASLRFNIAEADPQPKKLFIDLVDRAEGRIHRSNKVNVNL